MKNVRNTMTELDCIINVSKRLADKAEELNELANTFQWKKTNGTSY